MKAQPTRLEQLGNLLTAMIAVIVSGESNIGAVTEPKPIDPAFATRPPFGIYSRVARNTGTSVAHCRKVALGERQSAPIKAALLDELDRLKDLGVCATYEKTEFQLERAPFGTYTAIAKKLGCTPQHVYQVAVGLHKSKRVEAELARVMGGLQ